MQAAPSPPIEWVQGSRYWWVLRFVPAAALTVLFIGFVLTFVYDGWSLLPPGFPLIGVLLAGLAIEFALLYLVPSIRRIGFSPIGLVVDLGVRKMNYTWSDVSEIARTKVDRYRFNQVSTVSRTRVTVGSGLTRVDFALTLQQGDRLARFLHLQ